MFWARINQAVGLVTAVLATLSLLGLLKSWVDVGMVGPIDLMLSQYQSYVAAVAGAASWLLTALAQAMKLGVELTAPQWAVNLVIISMLLSRALIQDNAPRWQHLISGFAGPVSIMLLVLIGAFFVWGAAFFLSVVQPAQADVFTEFIQQAGANVQSAIALIPDRLPAQPVVLFDGALSLQIPTVLLAWLAPLVFAFSGANRPTPPPTDAFKASKTGRVLIWAGFVDAYDKTWTYPNFRARRQILATYLAVGCILIANAGLSVWIS